jgi:hypothetical protein
MFSGKKEADEPPKPKLLVFGIEADDLTGQMRGFTEQNEGKRRAKEREIAAGVSSYVEVSCAGKTFKSKTQPNTIDPVWADAMFWFGDDDKTDVLQDDKVVLTVKLSNGREIGSATISYQGTRALLCAARVV